jgi:calcineurin-like phosphoesterase family protein
MNNRLIENWNNVVAKDDIVWHLGDFAMGNKEEITNLVDRLNGRIFLILGNHDNHSIKWYYDCGFERVYDHPIIIDDYFILSHKPRTVGANLYGYIYGHVHNDDLYKDYTSNSICVSVERINYTPIKLEDAKKKMYNYNNIKKGKG